MEEPFWGHTHNKTAEGENLDEHGDIPVFYLIRWWLVVQQWKNARGSLVLYNELNIF